VGILSRGYRRNAHEKFLVVSDGKTILADPAEAGDEPFLMASRCPGVLVAVGADRYHLGLWVMKNQTVDCFVLDDGFQHLNLFREVNLLLVDVSDDAGMQALLPIGRLREPLSEARRSTAIIFTRVEDDKKMKQRRRDFESAMDRRLSPITLRFTAKNLTTGDGEMTRDPSWIKGKKVLLFSGVANAQSVRRLVESFEPEIVEELVYPDHMHYTTETIRYIQERCEIGQASICVTTEKDLVKVKPMWPSAIPIWAISLGIQFLDGQDRLEAQLHVLKSQGSKGKR